MLSAATAHEWFAPAVMAVYWPAGASALPELLLPQQTAVLSVLMAHEWFPPSAMAVNRPAGALACLKLL